MKQGRTETIMTRMISATFVIVPLEAVGNDAIPVSRSNVNKLKELLG